MTYGLCGQNYNYIVHSEMREKHWSEHTVCALCLTDLRPLDTHKTVSYLMCLISPH